MKQTCILILGMHRSGTSALSGTLNILDVYLGSDLISARENINPRGYYENTLLCKVNEKLLKQIGSSWDDVFYNESIPLTHIDTYELGELLKQEFQYSQLFAIKDPRLAYLFPLYTKALSDIGVEVKVIIPFRNPLEVANSLSKRDKFSKEKCLLLWAYHFLLSEKQSRDYPRVFTRFDELINSPLNVINLIDESLDFDLVSKFDEKKDQVFDFLTPDLKHHNIALENMSGKVPKIIRDIVDLVPMFNDMSLTTQFDKLRSQLFNYQTLFYNADITNALQELEQARERLQAKDVELEEVKQVLQARNVEVEQVRQGLKAKEVQLEQVRQGLQAKELELKQVQQEVISICLSNSWKITRPLRQAKRLFRIKE